MSLNYQFIKKPLEGVKSLAEFDTNLIKLARKDNNTYTQTVGNAYEVLAKIYFKLEYASTFKNVWYYKEIPADIRKKLNLPDKDKGVDLILESFGGKFTAVQCKFRANNETILFWGGVDHLAHLIGSGTLCDSYAVFSNAYEIDADVLSKMKEKPHSFDVLNGTLSELTPEFWDNVRTLVEETKPKAIKDFTPYPDQKEAIDAVVAHFKKGNKRAKMIRFCGTGKTKIAKWIKEEMKPEGLTILLVPSLSLAKQAKKDWNGNILYVCSDQSVESKEQRQDREEDMIEADILSLGPNVTTDIKEIRDYADKLPQGVIISTYQSCHLLKVALKDIKVSLTIFDESHRTASKEDSQYATLLNDSKGFVSDFRLFMTATQRVVSAQVRNRQKNDVDLPYLFSMDDEKVYGQLVNDFNLRMAIDAKRVTPYLPVVTVITDEIIKENIVLRPFVKGYDKKSYDMLANVYACLQAIELKKVKHFIVYHSNIKASKEFIEIMKKVRPDIYSEHIDGTMTAEYRRLKFDDYASASIGILSNSRCLTEGVDIPSVDCIVFCDNKTSKIDIIQAMGRSMRIDYAGKVAYIVVPIYAPNKKVTEKDIADSNYSTLIYLLKALSEIDFKMQDFITNICVQKGRKNKSLGKNNVDTQGVEITAGMIDFLGDEFNKHFSLEEISEDAKNHFMYWYNLLFEYWLENGHTCVANSKNGFGKFSNNIIVKKESFDSGLGRWCRKQRSRKSQLSKMQIDLLNKINFPWSQLDYHWMLAFEKFKQNPKENVDWAYSQKVRWNKLSKDRQKLLNENLNFFESTKEHKNKISLKDFCEKYGFPEVSMPKWIKSGKIKYDIHKSIGGRNTMPFEDSDAFSKMVDSVFGYTITFKELNKMKAVVQLELIRLAIKKGVVGAHNNVSKLKPIGTRYGNLYYLPSSINELKRIHKEQSSTLQDRQSKGAIKRHKDIDPDHHTTKGGINKQMAIAIANEMPNDNIGYTGVRETICKKFKITINIYEQIRHKEGIHKKFLKDANIHGKDWRKIIFDKKIEEYTTILNSDRKRSMTFDFRLSRKNKQLNTYEISKLNKIGFVWSINK